MRDVLLQALFPYQLMLGIAGGFLLHEVIRTWLGGGDDDMPDGFT